MSRPKVKCYDLRSTRALRVEGDGAEIGRRVFIGISIHALRVEGDGYTAAVLRRNFISIHALRVEGDNGTNSTVEYGSISIHALRVEGDVGVETLPPDKLEAFLSTPSGWRATNSFEL